MKIKKLSVDYIESGTFIGGEEDSYNFGVSDQEAYVVVRTKDLKKLQDAHDDLKFRMDGLEK